ncbi:Retrotransposon, Pao [Cinara cedri]|uniref:Retrotransposon, Pao n=1 Tax=Cinara cedri TaxID=506608 RepID=A0A5E4M8W0_9HEMI|nr:Retrotransposon, Pao [Cinara cedri]
MSFNYLNTFELPQHIMNSSENGVFLLHGFSDSSKKAYTAVVYIVSTQEHSTLMLLTAKTRVTLIKKMTIPRGIQDTKLDAINCLAIHFICDRRCLKRFERPRAYN